MKKLILFVSVLLLSGCTTTSMPRLQTAEKVDLQRFMGPWYVIAAIPTFIEKEAYNAVEEYALRSDGTIDTYYTFNKGGFDGPLKTYNPRGFIVDDVNNSIWKMRFVWPFKAEYLITYVSPDYSQTLITRNKRDFFWMMARTPTIPERDYNRLLKMLEEQGYDITQTRKYPHNWDGKTYISPVKNPDSK